MMRWLLGYPSSHPSVHLSFLSPSVCRARSPAAALGSRSLPFPDASHNALPLYYLGPRIHSFLVGVDMDMDLIGHAPALLSFPPSFLHLRHVLTANLIQVCFCPASELSRAGLGLLVARCLLSTLAFSSSALASRKQTVVTLPCPRYTPVREASNDWRACEILLHVNLDDMVRVGTA